MCFLISEKNDRLAKSASSSNISAKLRSSTILSSINNSQSADNLLRDDDDDELEMISDAASIIESTSQHPSLKENVNATKYPFETDKISLQKKTTASGKKLSSEVYELFEQQADGTYRCTLCTDQLKVTRFFRS
jgi:hypothetical protein